MLQRARVNNKLVQKWNSSMVFEKSKPTHIKTKHPCDNETVMSACLTLHSHEVDF